MTVKGNCGPPTICCDYRTLLERLRPARGREADLLPRFPLVPSPPGSGRPVGCDDAGLPCCSMHLPPWAFWRKSGCLVRHRFCRRVPFRHFARYLGIIIRHHHHLMASWSHLDEAVRTGAPSGNVMPRLTRPVTGRASSWECSTWPCSMRPGLCQASICRPLPAARTWGSPGTYAVHFCLTTRSFGTGVRSAVHEALRRGDHCTFRLSDRFPSRPGLSHGPYPGPVHVAWLPISCTRRAAGCAVILEKAVSVSIPEG